MIAGITSFGVLKVMNVLFCNLRLITVVNSNFVKITT